MECPNCNSLSIVTKDSRKRPEDGFVFRCRACRDCGTRFKTYETYCLPRTDAEISMMIENAVQQAKLEMRQEVVSRLFGDLAG